MILDLTVQEADLLRDLLTRARSRGMFDERLSKVDYKLAKALGCDPYVIYQDILLFHRNYLIESDGSINLNGAEGVLAEYGESDLNLAERVLGEWRDRGLTD